MLLLGLACLLISSLRAYEELSRKFEPLLESRNLVVYNSTTKLDTIQFSFNQYAGIPSIRINGTRNDRKVDFRLMTVRVIEFNKDHPIEKSASTYEFNLKEAWSEIKVDKFTESFNKRLSNVIRMNLTFVDQDFHYEMSLYLTDRSCFHGTYSLDSDSVYIVQKIAGFPYKYQDSGLAVEQIVGSKESGVVTSYLNVLESPFLGSLIINREAIDTGLGKMAIAQGDYKKVDFEMLTSDLVRETDYQQVYVRLGENQQPKNVTFEEKFSINLRESGNKGKYVPGSSVSQPVAGAEAQPKFRAASGVGIDNLAPQGNGIGRLALSLITVMTLIIFML